MCNTLQPLLSLEVAVVRPGVISWISFFVTLVKPKKCNWIFKKMKGYFWQDFHFEGLSVFRVDIG
jgi:hypothetical protein